MRAIIADDSMVIRSIISKAIKPAGYIPLHAANGREVLDILEREPEKIDIILLDWNMPVMDGFKTLVALQEDIRFSPIPVIMVTTESEDKNIELVMNAGAKGYITKPFTADELIAKLQRILS
jgi:two-component system chemotaxis response regulator CheY